MRACILLILWMAGLANAVRGSDGDFNIYYFDPSMEELLQISGVAFHIDDAGGSTWQEALDFPFGESPNEATAALRKLNPLRDVWMRFHIAATDSLLEDIAFWIPHSSRRDYYLFASDGQSLLDSAARGLFDIGRIYTQSENRMQFLLPVLDQDGYWIYCRLGHSVRSHQIFRMFIAIGHKDDLQNYHDQNAPARSGGSQFMVFFCGLLLFQVVYVLLQWRLVRRPEYLFYIAYLISVFVYFYARYSAYLAESPSLALIDYRALSHINELFLILPIYFYLNFARHFTDLRSRDFQLFRHFRWAEYFILLCLLITYLLRAFPNDLDKGLGVYMALITMLVFSLYALPRIAMQRRNIAWFLVVGSSFALLGHITANAMSIFGFKVPPIDEPVTMSATGILLEIIIFNTGLLFKARGTEVEKVEAQQAYIQELKTRQRIQEEYAQVRDKIASDLHDDIGSSLSSLSIYAYAAGEKLQKGEQDAASELIHRIEKGSRNTLNAMSDLVWATNPANDSSIKLIERIKEFAYEVLSAAECKFQVQVDPKFYLMPMNQAQRKNVLLITKEAFNNIVKYAGASVVHFRIEAGKDEGSKGSGAQDGAFAAKDGNHKSAPQSFMVSISDNGRGIPSGLLRPLESGTVASASAKMKGAQGSGNGLRNMMQRAAELGGQLHIDSDATGTRIRFELRERL